MKKTKKIAISAILSSLIVVILLLGAIVDVLDISVALVSSFLILFCVAELGYKTALSTFGVSAVLSLLFLPNKSPAILFAAVFGYMPITKFFFEKVFRRFSILPKLLLFNGTAILVGVLFWELFGLSVDNIFGLSATVMKILYLLLANVIFFLADVLYSRLVLLYIRKYREKIGKYLK